jgi:hypothetical protein
MIRVEISGVKLFSDNSNQTVLLWSDPPAEFPMKLPIGTTIISYVATDSSYNQAVCEFTITVLGESEYSNKISIPLLFDKLFFLFSIPIRKYVLAT